MLIIEIALGIVLGALILRFLPTILGLGVLTVFIGVVLLVVVGGIYFLYWGLNTHEFKEILNSTDFSELFQIIFITVVFFVMYRASLDGETWLELSIPLSFLLIGLIVGIAFFVEGLKDNKTATYLAIVFIIGVLLPVTLLLLRMAVKYNISNKQLSKILHPHIMLWLGFKGKD